MDAFYGEIRAFPYTYPPRNWAYCNGQLLPIQQFQALCAIIGFTFGGDHKTTFGLPNLNGLTVAGVGPRPGGGAWAWGQVYGAETVVLNNSTVPPHTHQATAAAGPPTARTATPNVATPFSFLGLVNDGKTNLKTFDVNPTNLVAMSSRALSTGAGLGGPHENRQPVLPLSWCMAVSDANWPEKP